VNILQTLAENDADFTIKEHRLKNFSEEKIHIFPLINKFNASFVTFDPKNMKVNHYQSKNYENEMFEDIKDKLVPFLNKYMNENPSKSKQKKHSVTSNSIQ
jgi:hypothetical protein